MMDDDLRITYYFINHGCILLTMVACAGVEKGIDEDDMVALELGASSLDDLSDVQVTYAAKIKEKLRERAAELKVEEDARLEKIARTYLLGKEAYE